METFVPPVDDPLAIGFVEQSSQQQQDVLFSLSHQFATASSYPVQHGRCSAAVLRHASFEGAPRGRLRSGSTPRQPALSDSGFGSTLSNGSSASCLPPPPPYRLSCPPNRRSVHRSVSDSKYAAAAQHFQQQQRNLANFGSRKCSSVGRASRSPSPSTSTVSCPEYGELQERLRRLAVDRQSLTLQVAVLTEQVGAQTDKIKDLEAVLEEKRRKLDSTEEMLQSELGNRSSLESNKLDLMAEISSLKMKFASLERNKMATELNLRNAQDEIDHLQKLFRGSGLKETQSGAGGQQPTVSQDELSRLVQTFRQRTGEIDQLRYTIQQLINENEQKNLEIGNLHSLLDQQQFQLSKLNTMSFSASSSTQIPKYNNEDGYETRPSPGIPRSISAYASSGGYALEQQTSSPEFDINEQLRRLLVEDGQKQQNYSNQSNRFIPVHSVASPSHHCGAVVPQSSSYTSGLSSALSGNRSLSPSSALAASAPSDPHLAPITSGQRYSLGNAASLEGGSGSVVEMQRSSALQLANELNQLRPTSPGHPPGPAHYFGSLPRSRNYDIQKSESTMTLPTALSGRRKKMSGTSVATEGEWARPPKPPKLRQRGLNWLRQTLRSVAKRSTSVPNLDRKYEPDGTTYFSDDDEGDDDELEHGRRVVAESDDETVHSGRSLNNNAARFRRDKKQRSLRNLFGRLKRSNSQELEQSGYVSDSGFGRRALARSTVGGRLAVNWKPPTVILAGQPPANGVVTAAHIRPTLEVFLSWDRERLFEWLLSFGLQLNVVETRRLLQSGRHLLSMTQHEMEKELGIKNPLHRKKLKLSLCAIEEGKTDAWDRMDCHQVIRWLDDIGLPQLRDTFSENLVDGQVLVALTVEDLLFMKISSALQHATLSRGVELLKRLGFSLGRIQRKFNHAAISRTPCPHVVELWSQHCVSEWLRTIDLNEFTPNLMCSGIHGALLVLEPTFTAESLAEVLRMPPTKTLIRRHLITQFNQLLGHDIIARKREILAQAFVVQLGPLLKVKPLRKGFSLARKKSKTDVYVEPDELVCPPFSAAVALSSSSRSDADSLSIPTVSEDALERMVTSNV